MCCGTSAEHRGGSFQCVVLPRQGLVEQGFGVGSREEVPSWDLGPVRVEMGLSPEGVRVAGTWSQATDGVQLPDLTNKNTRHLVTFEFQINKE